jgi:tetratricopeptide (TPR) repeat protein
MRGHERERGVVLVEQALAREDALFAIGEALVPALELALSLCEAQRAEPARCMRLRARLVGCAYLYEKRLVAYAEPLLSQLPRDGGIELMRELPGDGLTRLTAAIQEAQRRYEATPREQRGMAPIEALVELGGLVGSTLAVAIFGYDGALIDRLAAIVAPFGELDDRQGLRVMHDLVQVILELMAGRISHASALRTQLIQRLRDPARYLGVSDSVRKSIIATQLHARGMREAISHTGRALALADEIDALDMKMYVGAAQQIRLLAYLYRGDVEAAKRCQLRLDSVSLQGGAGRQTEIWLLSYLVGPYSLWGDVIALKRTAERLGALVPDHPGYRPQLYIALAAYYRERGQIDASKNALERALQLPSGGWSTQGRLALSQKVETLVAAGEFAQALALAEQCFGEVAGGDQTDREFFMQQLLPARALAQAHLGDIAGAAAALDAGIALAQADDRPLAFQGKLYEARARVAILAGDRAAFEDCERRAAELYRGLNNSVLLLKHLALLAGAAQAGMRVLDPREGRGDVVSVPTVQERRSGSVADTVTHEGDGERFEHALTLLLDCTSAAAGVLLAGAGASLRLAASSAGERVDAALLEAARSFAARTLQTESQRNAAASDAASWTAPDGRRYQLLPLTAANAQPPALAGVALLRAADEAPLRMPTPALLAAVARAVQEAAELSTGRPLGDWLAI